MTYTPPFIIYLISVFNIHIALNRWQRIWILQNWK